MAGQSANTGSVALFIFNSISPMPSNVSGLLSEIVHQNVHLMELYTGDTISTDPLSDRYLDPLRNLSTAQTLRLLAVQDGGVQSVTIGELSTNNTNLRDMAKGFEEMGMLGLKSLSKGVKFYKARG